MLWEMMLTCGAFPSGMLKVGDYTQKHFEEEGDFLRRDPMGVVPLQEFSKAVRPVKPQIEEALKETPSESDAEEHASLVCRFADFLSRCIILDHSKRVTPEEALTHEFFKKG